MGMPRRSRNIRICLRDARQLAAGRRAAACVVNFDVTAGANYAIGRKSCGGTPHGETRSSSPIRGVPMNPRRNLIAAAALLAIATTPAYAVLERVGPANNAPTV